MIVKKQLHPLVWAFFMSCSLGIVSCVDSKYDLDKGYRHDSKRGR